MVRSLGQRVYKVWSDGLMVKCLGQPVREGFILIDLQSFLDVIDDLYYWGDQMTLDGIRPFWMIFHYMYLSIPFLVESLR